MTMVNPIPESHLAALRLNVAALADARWHLRNFLFATPLSIVLFALNFGGDFNAIGLGLFTAAIAGFILYRILVVLTETHDDLAERTRELTNDEVNALASDVPALRDQLVRWRRIRPLTVLDRTALLDQFIS